MQGILMRNAFKKVRFLIPSTASKQTLTLQGMQYRFGSPKNKRILITGGVHGDEPTAIAALWYLIEKLRNESIKNCTVTIIPCVNELSTMASNRTIPLDGTDLNRCFPGRKDGSHAERLAATLAKVIQNHDALIDVHTAGWCIPFILIDEIRSADLVHRVESWALQAPIPVIGEMPQMEALLQGLDRSWSSYALSIGKPAFTLELSGFHTVESVCAKDGANILWGLLSQFVSMEKSPIKRRPFRKRREIFSETTGIFEAFVSPGMKIQKKGTIGVIRSLSGNVIQEITSEKNGLIIALQPISAVQIGSWVVTVAV